MSNIEFKLSAVFTVLLLTQSALAGSHVRYLCQLNIGPATGPVELTNEVVVVQSVDPRPIPIDKFKRDFMSTSMRMNFQMTRYKDVDLDVENPYQALDHLTRDQMVGEVIDNDHPSRVIAGDVHFFHTVKDKKNREKKAQMIIKSVQLDLVVHKIFPKGEYFLHEKAELFVCHDADFFETKVSEEELYIDDQSADFTSY